MSFIWNPYLSDRVFGAAPRGHRIQPLNPKYAFGLNDEDEDDYGYNHSADFGNHFYTRGSPSSVSPFHYRQQQQPQQQQPSLRDLQALRQQEAERRHREHLEYQRLMEMERLRELQLENQRIRELNLRRHQQQQQQYQQQRESQEQAQKIQQLRQLQVEQQRQQEAQRIQQIQQLRQQQQKQEEEARRKQQEAQREALIRRKAAFLRFTHAAKVIQRQFRIHLAERKHRAARVIQDAWKAADARKQAKEITQKLAHLRTLAKQLDALRAEHEDKVLSKPAFNHQQLGPETNTTTTTTTTTSGKAVLPNKEFLVYEDALLKFMIKLDSISSGGSELVRDVRKSLVAKAQQLLNTLDRHRTAPLPAPAPVPSSTQPDEDHHHDDDESPASSAAAAAAAGVAVEAAPSATAQDLEQDFTVIPLGSSDEEERTNTDTEQIEEREDQDQGQEEDDDEWSDIDAADLLPLQH